MKGNKNNKKKKKVHSDKILQHVAHESKTMTKVPVQDNRAASGRVFEIEREGMIILRRRRIGGGELTVSGLS